MKLLLDTQVVLWALSDPARLGPHALQMIEAADNVFVSSVSFWELAIKTAIGKIVLDLPKFHARSLGAGFEPLAVTAVHALAVMGLPPLHGDPFDRMLIAQAVSEPLHFLTRDAALARYPASVTLV